MLFLLVGIGCTNNADQNETIIPQPKKVGFENFQLEKHITNLNPTNALSDFPYNVYLDSATYLTPQSIVSDWNVLDAKLQDRNLSGQIISTALTTKKMSRDYSDSIKYQPDEMWSHLDWSHRISYAALEHPNGADLFYSINDYWMSVICQQLKIGYTKNSNVKFSFKFKYIDNRAQQLGYNCGIGADSKVEKVIGNIIDNKWHYLFIERFWVASDWKLKLILGVLGLFTLYSYYCLYKIHIRKS